MSIIKKFENFNEGILSDLGDRISGLSKSVKRAFKFHTKPNTEYSKELKQYDLSIDRSSDKQSMNIYHDMRLVGKIELDPESSTYPIWLLKIFFYESETPKDKNYKRPDHIKGQKEQPYAIGKKRFPYDSDDALRAFWKWWSNNTKSGRLNNPDYRIKS